MKLSSDIHMEFLLIVYEYPGLDQEYIFRNVWGAKFLRSMIAI